MGSLALRLLAIEEASLLGVEHHSVEVVLEVARMRRVWRWCASLRTLPSWTRRRRRLTLAVAWAHLRRRDRHAVLSHVLRRPR